jgi:hypothetical protein
MTDFMMYFGSSYDYPNLAKQAVPQVGRIYTHMYYRMLDILVQQVGVDPLACFAVNDYERARLEEREMRMEQPLLYETVTAEEAQELAQTRKFHATNLPFLFDSSIALLCHISRSKSELDSRDRKFVGLCCTADLSLEAGKDADPTACPFIAMRLLPSKKPPYHCRHYQKDLDQSTPPEGDVPKLLRDPLCVDALLEPYEEYLYFYYDLDVSECEMGKFGTSDPLETVVANFRNHIQKEHERAKEIPVANFFWGTLSIGPSDL